MLIHLVRLIWNKKRSHTLLIIEILASFLVLFGVGSLIITYLNNYREPIGYQYENRWVIILDPGETPDSLVDAIRQRLKQRAQEYPEIEAASLSSGNTPFSNGTSNGVYKFGGISVDTYQFWVDDDYARTMDIPVVEGRWFNRSDALPDAHSVIITQAFKETVFGDRPALGKTLINDGDKADKKRIIGIIGNYKRSGEYEKNSPGVFYKANRDSWQNALVLHVRPGTDASFEARLMKDLGTMTTGWNLELSYMTDQRQNQHNIVLVPVITFLVISIFLLINVALGLFGVLSLSITRRRGEIGLRRALGATGNGISTQFIGEIWVLATFAMFIGLLFAVQFPLLNVLDVQASVYVMAILIAIVIIYGIVTLCALFPSRQAALIQPATALHEE